MHARRRHYEAIDSLAETTVALSHNCDTSTVEHALWNPNRAIGAGSRNVETRKYYPVSNYRGDSRSDPSQLVFIGGRFCLHHRKEHLAAS